MRVSTSRPPGLPPEALEALSTAACTRDSDSKRPLARVDAGRLGEAVSPGLGTGNALVVTLPVQLGVVAASGLLNLRLPRLVG
ncbi:hypothetical protein QF032_000828 [Streptomyces achromogenes]|uniref:Uncharacterized protein n=1 Tax=Streptomyces achromogenes TaxID=67255 RepID=A0ABU0PTV5_STRAH|nr:hypothetical protein [Streptomyces achromogenes]MDQ0681830.1 hypothetical protein [Streptomyces achromogenes]MDQ0828984.1 hypothetical protein [Streptomyces achromogenes]